jgi:predicted nucleic-acid-binding Zn-ribbon protein
MDFNADPDYLNIINYFEKQIHVIGEKVDNIFDWNITT